MGLLREDEEGDFSNNRDSNCIRNLFLSSKRSSRSVWAAARVAVLLLESTLGRTATLVLLTESSCRETWLGATESVEEGGGKGGVLGALGRFLMQYVWSLWGDGPRLDSSLLPVSFSSSSDQYGSGLSRGGSGGVRMMCLRRSRWSSDSGVRRLLLLCSFLWSRRFTGER